MCLERLVRFLQDSMVAVIIVVYGFLVVLMLFAIAWNPNISNSTPWTEMIRNLDDATLTISAITMGVLTAVIAIKIEDIHLPIIRFFSYMTAISTLGIVTSYFSIYFTYISFDNAKMLCSISIGIMLSCLVTIFIVFNFYQNWLISSEKSENY